MSNTEKTIEELEAEVMAELEEGMHDAPTKGAVAAEPMKKVKNGEMQDTGKAVVSPTQGDAPAKKVAGAAKEIGGDAAQKGEGAPEKMKKLNAMAHPKKKNGKEMEEGYTDEEIRALCHSKDHDDQRETSCSYEWYVKQKDDKTTNDGNVCSHAQGYGGCSR